MSLNQLRNWTLGFFATTAAVVVSYYWLDRPIALYVHSYVHSQMPLAHMFVRLTRIPEVLAVLLVVVFLVLAGRALAGHKLSRSQTVLMLCGVSLAVAVVTKDFLKRAFGRTWPDTWFKDNPSFVHDGAYGFHPFHGGAYYDSFPSGHSTMACAVMAVLWFCYPRFRALYALCMVAVAVGLVGANFHFLGDVIAGTYVGISAGWLVVTLWEMGERQVRPQMPLASGSEKTVGSVQDAETRN